MRTFLVAFFLTLGIVCALAQANNHIGGIGTGMYVGAIVNGSTYSYASGLPFGSSPPPTCSNSLDFTQACNSQYITVI